MRAEIIDILHIPEELKIRENDYEYLIAVSADMLLVIDRGKHLIDTIIKGHSVYGYILSARDENLFLEAISALKYLIINKISPIPHIQKHCKQ